MGSLCVVEKAICPGLDGGLQGIEILAHPLLEEQTRLGLLRHALHVEHVSNDLVAGGPMEILAIGNDVLGAVEDCRRRQSGSQAGRQQLDGDPVADGLLAQRPMA